MEPAQTPPKPPYQPPAPAETHLNRPSRVWLVVGALAVILLVVYAVFKFEGNGLIGTNPTPSADPAPRNTDPGIDGIIARDAPAETFQIGDCLRGFVGPLDAATVVTCETRHNAQFIGTADLEDVPYPGEPGTTEKAAEACKAIVLDGAVLTSHQWTYHFSQPSRGSWEAGDRSVACFLALVEADDVATKSVLPQESS